MKPIRYVEIDVPRCGLTYGEVLCDAAIGVTGDFKCYNSSRTCQDPANFTAISTPKTIRFCTPSADISPIIQAIPCVTSISKRPYKVDPGESMGVRESVSVSMHNFKDNDSLFDEYPESRNFNPYNKGTFWGKFFARFGGLEGYALRTIDGYAGQTLGEMVTRHYVMDGVTGPDTNGNVGFTAKDVLKFLDKDKAQYPKPSAGRLLVGIDETQTAITLTPSGVGDDYPSSGLASIGDEAVSYTRSGDNITLTGRGLFGSEQDEHDADETFQEAKQFTAESPADIFNTLLQQTKVPTDYYDLAGWQLECDTYLARLYSADIMKPTSVKQLTEEIIRESGLTVYPDLVNKKIRLKVLRQEVPVLTADTGLMLDGTFSSKFQKDKRVSEVWVYFGKKNPLEAQADKKNYTSTYAQVSENEIIALEDSPPAIREIPSRFITTLNIVAAQDIAGRIIARYESIPREIAFEIPDWFSLGLGDFIAVEHRMFEDSQGDQGDPVTCQIISIDESMGKQKILCQESIFNKIIPPTVVRTVYINADVYGLNLRTAHDSIYTEAESGDTVVLLIESGAIIGSVGLGVSLDIGDWPAGVNIEIQGTGRIQGYGGYGGLAFSSDGSDGGDALYTRHPVNITGNVEIYSGGGGGGGGSSPSSIAERGGGGAGAPPGSGSPSGTNDSGGLATYGGDGGAPGQSGQSGVGNGLTNGGSPGTAIDGDSFITITGSPDIRGPRVN